MYPTKEQILAVPRNHSINEIMMKCIPYKTGIQNLVILTLTNDEIKDIRECRLNAQVVEKLCDFGVQFIKDDISAINLYACAMSIGTIIKELDWGIEYVIQDGLYTIAQKLINRL